MSEVNPYAAPSVEASFPLPPPSSQPIFGTFYSPLLGATQAPSGLTGEGTIALAHEGIIVQARRMSTGLIGAFGLLGLLVGAVLGIYISALAKLEQATIVIIAFTAAFVIGGAYTGKLVGGRKVFSGLMRYDQCTDTALRGSRLTFIHTANPKGVVDFTARADMAQAMYAHFGRYTKG